MNDVLNLDMNGHRRATDGRGIINSIEDWRSTKNTKIIRAYIKRQNMSRLAFHPLHSIDDYAAAANLTTYAL